LYFKYNSVPTPPLYFPNIHKLKPGHVMTFDSRGEKS